MAKYNLTVLRFKSDQNKDDFDSRNPYKARDLKDTPMCFNELCNLRLPKNCGHC